MIDTRTLAMTVGTAASEPPSGVVDLLVPAPATASPLSWIAIVLAVLYLVGAIRSRRAGRNISMWRSAAFVSGCVLLWGITGTGVEQAGQALFSVFMFQQLTLMIAVPSLLVLGAPARVAPHLLPRGGVGQRLRRSSATAVRSRAARVALHPAVGIGLFLAAYYGLYLSPLAGLVLAIPLGDLLLESFFLLAGLLFAIPVLSSGPLPRPVSHGERALDVFVEMALHAFFGVLLMVSKTPIVPAFAASSAALGVDPLADQALAGGLAWSYGEAPAVLTLLYVMERWFRADTRAADRSNATVASTEEAELAAYNARLAGLAQRDPRP